MKLGYILLVSLCLAGLLVAGMPSQSMAQTGATNVGSLSLIPAFENIGVISNFSGDENGNNTTVLEYREVGGSWKRGMDLSPDRRDNLIEFNEDGPDIVTPNPYKNQWRGVILGLQPNTDYEVRVTYTDPNGVSDSPAVATVITRDDNPPSTGRTITLSGDLQSAVDSLTPGDTLMIPPGTYTGGIEVTVSGTPDNYITIQSQNPSNMAVITGGGHNFWLRGSYVRLRALDLRVPTGDMGSNVAVGWEDPPVAMENIIEDCIMTDPANNWGGSGVLLRRSAGTLIQRNTISTTDVGNRGYRFGVFFWGTGSYGGNVIRNNQITSEGTFRDNIGGAGNFQIEAGPGPNSFIYGNYLYGAYDDGIESEGGNMNVAIYNNTIQAWPVGEATWMIAGVGLASVVVGPLYSIRNTIVDVREPAHKIGSSSWGNAFLYHNTIFRAGYGLVMTSGNNRTAENYKHRNNIIHAQPSRGRVMGHYTDYIPVAEQTLDSDYNCLFDGNGPEWFGFWYNSRYNSLAAVRAGSVFEHHSIDGNPLLVDPENGNFTLEESSPAIDAGEIIYGINDPDSPWPYSGSAPDMGAFEYTIPVYLTIESEYGEPKGEGWYESGSIATFSVSSIVDHGDGSRHVFRGWSGDSTATTPSASVTMDRPKTVSAKWEPQYDLTVESEYGEPEGERGYESGGMATFSVPSIVDHGDGSRHVFLGWSGDSTATTPSASVTMDRPKTVGAKWKLQYHLTVSVNPVEIATVSGEGWYDEGTSAVTGRAPPILSGDTGTRYVFLNWTVDGIDSPGDFMQVDMGSPHRAVAGYKTQYYLAVESARGDPQGAGWHDRGSMAEIRVKSPLGMILRQVFNGWSGDLIADTPVASVLMDSPKTVTANWRTDYIQLYILIGGAIALAGAASSLVLVRRKRRRME